MRKQGFTLIEILAVAAILALVASFVVPNLSGLQVRALRSEAEQIAGQLELARQRAIVTGIPHRLWMELDEAEFRLEWLQSDPDALDPGLANPDLRGNSPISLAAPRAVEIAYRPIPGNFGRLQIVKHPFYFEGLETPEGWISRGAPSVEFERDGSANYTEIHIEDPAGNRVILDVHPLDERVRVRVRDDG
jgi:prepilin-type N-terminal cleavage/methylation domain-containing protein